MKKYLITTAAALLLGSCTMGPEEIGSSPAQGRFVTFSEAKAGESRAMVGHPILNNNNQAKIPILGRFGVISWKHSGSAVSVTEMENTVVTRKFDASPGNEVYSYTLNPQSAVEELAKWPADDSQLSFAAYYPHMTSYADDPAFTAGHGRIGIPQVTKTEARVNLPYQLPDASGSMIDFMYAMRNPEAYNEQTNKGKISLVFNHALARVTFSGQKAGFSKLDTVIIKKLSMIGVERAGVLSLDVANEKAAWSVNTITPAPNSTISLEDSMLQKNYLRSDMPLSLARNDTSPQYTTDAFSDFMLIPLPYRNGACIRIEVEVNSKPYKSYDIPLDMVPALEMNTVTDYLILVTPEKAEVSHKVLPWTEKDVDFVSDGQNYMETSRLEPFNSFAKKESMKSGENEELVVQTMTITTDAANWTVEKTTSLDWVHSVDRTSNNTFEIRLYPNHGEGAVPRSAPEAFVITAGNLKRAVWLEQKAGGVPAPPGFLGVGAESGRLTLCGSKEYAKENYGSVAAEEFGGLADETVYLALFRRNSLVGRSSMDNNGAAFTPKDIVWAPQEFDVSRVANWETMPHNGDWNSIGEINPAEGLGDPCPLADKGTSKIIYKMPSTEPFETWTTSQPTSYVFSRIFGTFRSPTESFYVEGLRRDHSAAAYPDIGYATNEGVISKGLKGSKAIFAVRNASSTHVEVEKEIGPMMTQEDAVQGAIVRCIVGSAPQPVEPYILYLTDYGYLALGQWYGDGTGGVSPTAKVTRDNIVYVKFGSTVGVKGVRYYGNDIVKFNPTGQTYNSYDDVAYGGSSTYRYISANEYHTPENIRQGKGDICRLVGLSTASINNLTDAQLKDYDSGYRTPTLEQNEQFLAGAQSGGNYWLSAGGLNGAMFPSVSAGSMKTFLPAMGYRDRYGTILSEGNDGYYWSDQITSMTGSLHNAGFLIFRQSLLSANQGRAANMSQPVRCVKKQ